MQKTDGAGFFRKKSLCPFFGPKGPKTGPTLGHLEIFDFFLFVLRIVLRIEKNCKNILFGLLIQFESFDLAANGLKRFLLWLSTIGHHSRMWKFGPEGSEGAQYGRKCLKRTIDRIWIFYHLIQ